VSYSRFHQQHKVTLRDIDSLGGTMVRSQMEELGYVHSILKAFTFFCCDLLLLMLYVVLKFEESSDLKASIKKTENYPLDGFVKNTNSIDKC